MYLFIKGTLSRSHLQTCPTTPSYSKFLLLLNPPTPLYFFHKVRCTRFRTSKPCRSTRTSFSSVKSQRVLDISDFRVLQSTWLPFLCPSSRVGSCSKTPHVRYGSVISQNSFPPHTGLCLTSTVQDRWFSSYLNSLLYPPVLSLFRFLVNPSKIQISLYSTTPTSLLLLPISLESHLWTTD